MSRVFDVIMGLFLTLTSISAIIIVECKLYDYMIIPMILFLIALVGALVRGFMND